VICRNEREGLITWIGFLEGNKTKIVRYALVAECWMGTMRPMPSAPVRTEDLEHYLDRYTNEYHRMGYSPSEGRDRDYPDFRFAIASAQRSASGRSIVSCSQAPFAISFPSIPAAMLKTLSPVASSICSKARCTELRLAWPPPGIHRLSSMATIGSGGARGGTGRGDVIGSSSSGSGTKGSGAQVCPVACAV